MDWAQVIDRLLPLVVALGAVALDRYLAGRAERVRLERERRRDVLDTLGALVRAGGDLWASLITAEVYRQRRDVPVTGMFVGPFDHEEWVRKLGAQVIELEVALARFAVHVGGRSAVDAAHEYVEYGREMTKVVTDLLIGSSADAPGEDDWTEWKERRNALYAAVANHLGAGEHGQT